MMETLFLRLVDMSLISSYCIAIVLLVRLLLRKSPKGFSYILWIAVFARLAFPLMLESPISLVPQSIGSQSVSSWMDKADAQTASQTPALSNEISEVTLENPANEVSLGTQTLSPATQSPVAGMNTPAVEAKPLSIPFIFSIVWLVGLVALAAYNLGAYRLLKRQLNSATRIDDKVFESSSISSPFLLGLFRPRIYLPAGLNDSYRTYILRHEQIHMQRGDYAVKVILFAITCVHWFNPLVWLAFGLMSRDMEMSCDEKVIRELGYEIKKNYSTSLLSLATGRSLLHATPLAFGEGNIKGRIKNVLSYKKPALWIILGSAVLVGIVVVGLILNPLQAKKAKKTDVPATTATTPTTVETTAETTAPVQTTSSEPNETQLVLDERYDNWFIDVDGEQISFREVLEMFGDYSPFTYGSPADYKTVAPVDVSDFEAVFTDAGYEVQAATSKADDVIVEKWNAESPDSKDTVTCTTYATEADANLAICQFAVRFYYDSAIVDPMAKPLDSLYTDSALVIFDAGNFAGDDCFVIQYLSGRSVISARIYVEIPRLQDCFTSMETLGLPFPGIELNKSDNTWPEKATLGSSDDFVGYFTGRGYNANESTNAEGLFHAESEDFNFQANYRTVTDKNYINWFYLWNVVGAYSTYLDYYSTGTYQMIVQGSSREYIVTIYIDDVCIDAWVNLGDLSEDEAAKMREEVDTVIRDFCFPT